MVRFVLGDRTEDFYENGSLECRWQDYNNFVCSTFDWEMLDSVPVSILNNPWCTGFVCFQLKCNEIITVWLLHLNIFPS